MLVVREMTSADLEQVWEIEKELFSVPWTKEGFLTYLLKPEALFLVAEEKEEILGYCGILMVLDEGDITNVAVKPSRQREGVGRLLLQSLILLTGERGIHQIHLEVRQSNAKALRLYEREGFIRDGLRKNYYTDPTENAILMTRKQ
ncbi:MAG: ribosomal protein S18-alanine N-acetyltransferase [Eubacteriales bacterium]|nr:ribosomal protein S18-alanine N-acetyltransferase [Eubacteriales bacterium]